MSLEATNSNSLVSPFYYGPFSDQADALAYGSRFLSVEKICSCFTVCKNWSAALRLSEIWLYKSDEERFPRIEGREKNGYEDFKFMYPRTLSARRINILGQFVGNVPMITAKAYEWFRTAMDTYEPMKKICDTFVIIVEPPKIRLDFDSDLLKEIYKRHPTELSAFESLKESELERLKKDGIHVPYTTNDLVILGEHIAKKNKKTLFFDGTLGNDHHLWNKRETSLLTDNAKVYFMRIATVKGPQNSAEMKCAKRLLKSQGLEMAPLCTRVYYEMMESLLKGTFPTAGQIGSTLTSDAYSTGMDPLGNSYTLKTWAIVRRDVNRTGVLHHAIELTSCEDNDIKRMAVGVPAEIVSASSTSASSTGKRTHLAAFSSNVGPVLIPEIKISEPQFDRMINVVQLNAADWTSASFAKNVSLNKAKRIAQENPKINFFFYVKGQGVDYGHGLIHRVFPSRTAVFFEGEPSWESNPQADGYIKRKVDLPPVKPEGAEDKPNQS
jgi:hypothetical protein